MARIGNQFDAAMIFARANIVNGLESSLGSHDDFAQPLSFSSWRRNQAPRLVTPTWRAVEPLVHAPAFSLNS
jgi:hypothetical protein